MTEMRQIKKAEFLLASFLFVVIIVFSISNYSRWWNLDFYVGPLYFHHWLSFIGGGYIAIFTPVFFIMKRRFPQQYSKLIKIHVFSNLIAFLFISMHFTQHMGEPPEFAPTLGTGITLYIIIALMVITGYINRFQLARKFSKTWRFIHVSLIVSFYIVIVIHVLHNLGVI
jgi:hypothetical protein